MNVFDSFIHVIMMKALRFESCLEHILSLHEKCPFSEFFWSVFSHIGTKYREMRRYGSNKHFKHKFDIIFNH